MLVYIVFYCISEHLDAWDRGNMNILRIGAKMTSGEPSGRPGWATVGRPENVKVSTPEILDYS